MTDEIDRKQEILEEYDKLIYQIHRLSILIDTLDYATTPNDKDSNFACNYRQMIRTSYYNQKHSFEVTLEQRLTILGVEV